MAFDEVADPVDPPWTVEALRAALKPGRLWALRETMVFYVGKDRRELTRYVEAKIKSVGQENYQIQRREFDAQKRLVKEGTNTGYYTFETGTYARLARSETEISEETIELAGRSWKAKVYRNRRVVDSQEQVKTIWTALDVPGLALKVESKSPRMTQTIELVEFQEGG